MAIARRYDSTITVFNVCSVVPATVYAPATPILPVIVPTPGDLEALLASMKRFVETEVGLTVPMQFEIGEGDAASEIPDRAG